MRASIWWLSPAWCALSVLACNQILDNRKAILRRETGTTGAEPTPDSDSNHATIDRDRVLDASRSSDPDAATQNHRDDAAPPCPTGIGSTLKSCGAYCASVTDPEYGCAATDCSPCDIPSAIPTCVNGACKLFMCRPGYADCNANVLDGCETDLMAPTSCGSCLNACPTPPHAMAACTGTCTFDCKPGWADCNGAEFDGCETRLEDDPDNCGQCGQACLVGGCIASQCIVL